MSAIIRSYVQQLGRMNVSRRYQTIVETAKAQHRSNDNSFCHSEYFPVMKITEIRRVHMHFSGKRRSVLHLFIHEFLVTITTIDEGNYRRNDLVLKKTL